MILSGGACSVHDPDLHRRGMGAQQPVGVEIEGVVHRPRRVMLGDIERLEVVVGVLDLRALRHRETGIGEQALDAPQGAGDGMQSARLLAAPRQGDVDALGGQPRPPGPPAPGPPCGHRCACWTRDLGLIDQLTGGRALLFRQRAELLEQRGQLAALAQIAHPHLIEGGQSRRRAAIAARAASRSGSIPSPVCSAMVQPAVEDDRPR